MTFFLGDFYVSTLAFQHIMFKEKSYIPKAQMSEMSENKILLIWLKVKFQNFQNKNVCIITDREMRLKNVY